MLDSSNAPPLRFAFEREPDVVLIPGTGVYEEADPSRSRPLALLPRDHVAAVR